MNSQNKIHFNPDLIQLEYRRGLIQDTLCNYLYLELGVGGYLDIHYIIIFIIIIERSTKARTQVTPSSVRTLLKLRDRQRTENESSVLNL